MSFITTNNKDNNDVEELTQALASSLLDTTIS
jgi:hypothetical protein